MFLKKNLKSYVNRLQTFHPVCVVSIMKFCFLGFFFNEFFSVYSLYLKINSSEFNSLELKSERSKYFKNKMIQALEDYASRTKK